MDSHHRPSFLRALQELIWSYRPRPSLAGLQRLRFLLPTPGNVLFTLLVITGLFWAQSVGAIPLGAPAVQGTSTSTIAYQGRLADSTGNPITAVVPMVFRLYNAASGGAPLWEENWTGANSVNVSDGLFNVMLGSVTQIPQAIVTGNSSLWLGITVNADNEMAPRVQLGTVPFAVQALTVPDGSVGTAKLADGSVTAAKIGADVSLVPPDGSITTAKLADGSVTTRKMRVIYGQGGGTRLTLTSTAQELPGSQSQFTVEVPSTILVTATFDAQTASSSSTIVGTVAIDGTLFGRQAILTGVNTRATVATSFPINVEPGTHTLSLAAFTDNGGTSQILDHSGYTYIVMAR